MCVKSVCMGTIKVRGWGGERRIRVRVREGGRRSEERMKKGKQPIA